MVNSLWEATPGLNSQFIALCQSPENYSYPEIAKRLFDQFGIPLSANACIGRAHRLGLPSRKLGKPPKWQRLRAAVEEPEVSEVSAVPTPHENLGLLELRANHCRFPLPGDRPYLFCCQQQLPSSPYCTTHHAVCRRRAKQEE